MLYITFIHLRYVKNAVVPKFSDIGYYIFMTINFDIGLLKSIFPCNYKAVLWCMLYIT